MLGLVRSNEVDVNVDVDVKTLEVTNFQVLIKFVMLRDSMRENIACMYV